ncbi:glycosyltransferase family 4 protein [Sanguibacter sp. HDW7]|uniref:glycosyltransferase family 4 protein n=1 Tax=Sanguibacter sp. HDW7 TaxID=2714931 RepID=UPI00140994AD|nr:glycosyltransferase family 4 protein [Sanguibacter sp. HDW7]QIK84271.1 glycosyltransferase family 4 protein [Sanguibacter sp. HDW7]
MFEWLDHLGLDARSETYLGGASAGLGALRSDMRGVLAAERRLRRLGRDVADSTVLLSRNASPLSRGGIESSLLRASAHGVYDFDDALFADPARGARGLFAKSHIWKRAVDSADVVIAGNDYLADAASDHASDVRVVPSCVEPADYLVKSDHRHEGRPPRAVWLGSPSTEKYLLLVADSLLREHARSGLTLRVVSRGRAPLGQLDPMVERIDWAAESFAADMIDGEFGIMPLPDDPWTRGKCAYKLLQYGAAGLPVIGSPVGASAEALGALSGAAADGEEAWSASLAALVDADVDGRSRMGAQARAGVEENYSFRAWAGTWRGAVLSP